MRCAIAQPCMGSRATTFRMSRSSVPCTRSVGLLMRLPSSTDTSVTDNITALAADCNSQLTGSRAFGGGHCHRCTPVTMRETCDHTAHSEQFDSPSWPAGFLQRSRGPANRGAAQVPDLPRVLRRRPDAAYAAGDPKMYWAPSLKQRQEAKPGLPEGGTIQLAPGAGRFGDALRFTAKKSPIVFFRGDRNMPHAHVRLERHRVLLAQHRSAGRARTGLLRSGADHPARVERCGVLRRVREAPGIDSVPAGCVRGFERLESAQTPVRGDSLARTAARDRRETAVRRGKWTHVLFTFERFNTGRADGVARLYLDGQPHGGA